ncbi:MAG: hypothetical protein KDB53_06215, partial [Planctomycetes bacterium]|nr:hypothetical protein [Planctomycetota bacterium]
FLAYAWPETWGETGRRVFVVDPSPGVRAWDHGLELISGTTSPPPAWLAMPREGDAYPFARSARGWQKKIRWQEVDAP